MPKSKEVKEAMAALGRFGGLATKKKHGKDHFSKIARLSWVKRRKKVIPK